MAKASTKHNVSSAKPTPAAKPAKLPRAKQLGVQVGKLMNRSARLEAVLAKYGTPTESARAAVHAATTALSNARVILDALPDDALAHKAAGKKVLAVGDKVMLTDKARESFKDVLTDDEAKAVFEVIAVASQVRVKAPSGAVLFLKRGKLAPVTTV